MGIFESEGARKRFLDCLEEASVAQGWRLHAWVLMSNHYHLCLETPKANLVEGMKWLQSTFANRFNRYRKANGHVFQGRYKAILLEGKVVGPVIHYIHLNPVRAGLVTAAELQQYTDSSFHPLWYPSKRWPFLRVDMALKEAGGWTDTPKGRLHYREYLTWLSEDDVEKKQLGFETMCRGWVKGDKEFRKAVLDDLKEDVCLKVVEAEAKELREPLWERRLKEGLEVLGKSEAELTSMPKGCDWKVALARHLRERSLIPNRWLAERLNMGTPKSVSSRISSHRSARHGKRSAWDTLQRLECVD